MAYEQFFSKQFVEHWDRLAATGSHGPEALTSIDGKQLDLASVVGVARYTSPVELSPQGIKAIENSCNVVKDSLARGEVVYGVNTGFGGSADVRSQQVQAVQNTLIRGLQYGILSKSKPTGSSDAKQSLQSFLDTGLPTENPEAATAMPESWSRAAMIIRLNSLAGGSSGIQLLTAQVLTGLLNENIVPQIPVRGSISASGDLSPLAYIAGAMQGRHTVKCWAQDRQNPGQRKLMGADQALKEAGISPITLGPKEGLAIVNGTAICAGVASLAMHEAHNLAAMSQILTAMSVESLLGTDESFDPFIAEIRPHPGQIDSARSILKFLNGSKLIANNDGQENMSLRQDRYSIRTASQWVGPILEDLLLAHSQMNIEMNSVTDNPLINGKTGDILHGGNFQAKAVSTAMEKTRAALQTIGRMLFTQVTEIINPATNRGLPPNLVVDDPSCAFLWKGTDLMSAALTAELGFLASPVAPHVQTAEMGNQSINSLALVSARYTLMAADTLTQLSAAHLIACCQALDLRAMNLAWLEALKPEFSNLVKRACEASGTEATFAADKMAQLEKTMWLLLLKKLDATASMDPAPRIAGAVESLQPAMLKGLPDSVNTIQAIKSFEEAASKKAHDLFQSTRTSFRANPKTDHLLGAGAKVMYNYVRNVVKVPFMGEGEIAVPGIDEERPCPHPNSADRMDEVPTMGGYITKVYDSMKSGALYSVMVECFRNTKETNGIHRTHSNNANGVDVDLAAL